MKCPECEKGGERSSVYPGVATMTLAYSTPFYDEEGRYHHHDRNTTTCRYSCSHGHEWTETYRAPCCCSGERPRTPEDYVEMHL